MIYRRLLVLSHEPTPQAAATAAMCVQIMLPKEWDDVGYETVEIYAKEWMKIRKFRNLGVAYLRHVSKKESHVLVTLSDMKRARTCKGSRTQTSLDELFEDLPSILMTYAAPGAIRYSLQDVTNENASLFRISPSGIVRKFAATD